MTDKDIADRVYIEPLNAATVLAKIIKKEEPDSYICPHLGGQACTQHRHGAGGNGPPCRSTACTMLGTSSDSHPQTRRTARPLRTPSTESAQPCAHQRGGARSGMQACIGLCQGASATRWSSARPTLWAAAAAVLPMICRSFNILPAMVCA